MAALRKAEDSNDGGSFAAATLDDRQKACAAFPGSGWKLMRHPVLDAMGAARDAAHERLSAAERDAWRAFLERLLELRWDAMPSLVEDVAELDVAQASAWIAWRHRHVRPDVCARAQCGEGSSSSLDARGLRHPVIEAIKQDLQYVPNDVALCCDGVPGLLLYGVNASGKSSLMKSVGLAAIMAQAGMFAACASLRLVPFHSIHARVGSRDDLVRGQSTFEVEMLELREIFLRIEGLPHGTALVVGDELCCGTEAVSALACVASAVRVMHDAGAAFVLATHLHDLAQLPDVAALQPPIRVAHMTVHDRPGGGGLVYDRQLCDGVGRRVYGLQVCRGLAMPRAFLAYAEQVRRHVEGVPPLLTDDRSPHNAKVRMGRCGVCGATRPLRDKDLRPLESHHIVPQARADAHGFVGPFHKNAPHNLVPLCGKCHHDHHNERIVIKGFVDTCELGTVLDVERRG